MKKQLSIFLLALSSSLFWAACNCENTVNKLEEFNPKQKEFFGLLQEGYFPLQFKSSTGLVVNLNVYNNITEYEDEQLNNGACPVWRVYQTKQIRYEHSEQNFYQYFNFRIDSKIQPGDFTTQIYQGYPNYSNGTIRVDLHNPKVKLEGDFPKSETLKEGFTFIGDSTFNGHSFTDLYVLHINKLPTAFSSEIKTIYLSFTKGLVGYRQVNGLVWMLK